MFIWIWCVWEWCIFCQIFNSTIISILFSIVVFLKEGDNVKKILFNLYRLRNKCIISISMKDFSTGNQLSVDGRHLYLYCKEINYANFFQKAYVFKYFRNRLRSNINFHQKMFESYRNNLIEPKHFYFLLERSSL